MASNPMASTNTPAQLWLNSDHILSATSMSAVFDAASVWIDRDSAGGLTRRGGRVGIMRSAISEIVAWNSVWSMAGGCDAMEAAIISTVMPIPISTSAKRRRRNWPRSSASERVELRFMAASSSSTASRVILAPVMMP
jgi:hypothetical protein